MEDFHDHPRSVEHLRAGGVFQIARLAWRDLMIDDDEFRLACAVLGFEDLRDWRRSFESTPAICAPMSEVPPEGEVKSGMATGMEAGCGPHTLIG
jgi:hypothetical protein